MKQGAKVWMALLGLAMLLVSAIPASAFVYTPGEWGIFSTSAFVVAPLATPGTQWGGMMGNQDNDWVNNDPFTFILGGSATLKVTDIALTGDYYRCWDSFNGGAATLLFTTSASVWADAPAVFSADDAYAAGGLGGATFSTTDKTNPPMLLAGSHALTFQNVFLAQGDPGASNLLHRVPGPGPDAYSDAAFRVDPVPEPGTMARLGLGLGFAGLVIRRKR